MNQISEIEYSDLIKQSYIDYSMSVITDRAVPDARDGLKPVQRRVLYDMYKQHMWSSKSHKKCAKIVGDVLGRFHPHGDQSAYDALVVMSQPWKKTLCLIDGHGNFGSLEGDPPAAMRYTEAKLSAVAETCYLSDLDKPIVPMLSNFDDTEKEPEILPCLIPNLLINGAEGIAVGMATKIPTHNVGEVIDAAIKYMENPDLRMSTLLKYLPGPDFPSGGIITNPDVIKSIYETGKGKFKIRGKYHVESVSGSTRKRIVITELPYTMLGENIHKFLEETAKLVESKEISGIVDISNQSAKGDIKIIFDVRSNADTKAIMRTICDKTKFEDTFSVNMLAVHNKRPEIINLKAYLKIFLDFQREIYNKKFKYLKDQETRKLEILEGLIKATEVMPAIVYMLSGCETVEQAKKCLMTGDVSGISFQLVKHKSIAAKFRFTELQATTILDMKLSKLIKMEIKDLKIKHTECKELLKKYLEILKNPELVDKEIRKKLLSIRRKYAQPRKTTIKS